MKECKTNQNTCRVSIVTMVATKCEQKIMNKQSEKERAIVVYMVFRKLYQPQIYINDWSHLANVIKSYNVFIANAYDVCG